MSKDERKIGYVEHYNNKRKFGFIKIIGEEVTAFVHVTEILPKISSYKTLYKGEYVSFNLENDGPGKYKATSVRGISDGPLMCDHRMNNYMTPKNGENGDNVKAAGVETPADKD